MKCPRCNCKLDRKYKYCYDCGVNVKEYSDSKRLRKDIRASVFLSIISLLLIIGYPTYEYFAPRIHGISIQGLLSSNTKKVSLECTKDTSEYTAYYDMQYTEGNLEQYKIEYKFNNEELFNNHKNKLENFKNETGIKMAFDISNISLSYYVETRSVVNDLIYDIDNVNINYNEESLVLETEGFICK